MDNKPALEGLLSPFHVLDLTNEKGYYFCTKILGDLGAGVIRLEKEGAERDFWWWAYNTNKSLVYLDIEKERDKLLQLARDADILVESFPVGYLDRLGLGYTTLSKVNPKLILTSLTPFGQNGPYKDWKASDLELMALSGISHGMGDDDRAPVRISFPQSHLITSSEAAVGILMAICQRQLTGEGQHVDVSAQECVHCMLENRVRKQGVLGNKTRQGRFHPEMPSAKHPEEFKYHHYKHPQLWGCKDGHVAFLLHPARVEVETNRILTRYMDKEGDLPDLVRNVDWETFDWADTTPEDAQVIWDTFARFFNRHTHSDLYQIALKERIQLFPGNTIKDLLDDGQLAARGYWQEQEIPDLHKTLKFPGPFAKIQFAPPAPQKPPEKKQNQPGLPFKGVKVLDFTWVVMGPWLTQWLAVYGAEVVKVESSKLRGTARRGPGHDGGFIPWNSAKKSLVMNLKNPRSQELARQLVAWADVVIENFSPGTIQRMGFGYEELLKINPRIILMSASMLGATGPYANQPGLGQILSSLSGFTELTGWPDRLPVTAHGPYTDVISCRIGAATLFAALEYQRRTGNGCYIDLAQYETSAHFLTPLILEYQANGKLFHRMGNRSLTDAPHGAFPCQGEDVWCTLSVSNDTEWQAFCKVLGKPEWVKDPRFATFEKRKHNEDELEEPIAAWTSQLPPEEVMKRLQKAGVKAGLVESPDDLLKDPQYAHRNHFVTIKHAELGEYDYVDSGFRLEKARPVINPAPLFGEHTKYVATNILGLSDEEFDACYKAGCFE